MAFRFSKKTIDFQPEKRLKYEYPASTFSFYIPVKAGNPLMIERRQYLIFSYSNAANLRISFNLSSISYLDAQTACYKPFAAR